MGKVKNSQLWNELSKTLFSGVNDAFLETFRAPGGTNNRLAAWDPFDKTARYFKLLLFGNAVRMPDRFFELYGKLRNVDLGAPMHVSIRDCRVNIDYLLSVDEFMFLEEAMDVGRMRRVAEIGAGFGRTCHALMALSESIEQYVIIDLPEIIALSRKSLGAVLPEETFVCVTFIDKDDIAAWTGLKTDLAINIDSFQEMPEETIRTYMTGLIEPHSDYFYCKNPVAKYAPSSIGLPDDDKSKFLDVFSLGLCRDVIDIFDDEQLRSARRQYVEAYRPGPGWKVLTEAPLEVFPSLHHCLFERHFA